MWCLKSQEQLFAVSLYTWSDSGVIHLFGLWVPPLMWALTGSVLIGFRRPQCAGTWQNLLSLHATPPGPQQRFSDLLLLGSRKPLTLTLSLLGSRWYHFSHFLLLPFPGKALMCPTWTLSRPHVVLWLPELSESSAYFTTPAPVLCLRWDWNLTFNSWCFKLSSLWQPDPKKKNPNSH